MRIVIIDQELGGTGHMQLPTFPIEVNGARWPTVRRERAPISDS